MKFFSFVNENKLNIAKIFASNALMLICGFLGEIRKIGMNMSVAIGTIFFLYTFYVIWEEYAKHSGEGVKLFKFLFIVWGLYAVVALMRPKIKILVIIYWILYLKTFMVCIFIMLLKHYH